MPLTKNLATIIDRFEQHDDYREELAALCHEQWSGWMRHFLGKCEVGVAGTLVVPEAYLMALRTLMDTPYADLPESQKDNDRQEADRILALR